MTTLTESIVLSRSRADDLNAVRKLNCWGSELGDVSLLRRMKSVEVLSLSVNKITTLADFAHCPNLQELYIRKNEIRNLGDVCYLTGLKNLRSLWLADNPCADTENYRHTVIKALPHLQKLDNIVVKQEEIQNAMIYGDTLSLSADDDKNGKKTPSPPPRHHSGKRQISTTSHSESAENITQPQCISEPIRDENKNISNDHHHSDAGIFTNQSPNPPSEFQYHQSPPSTANIVQQADYQSEVNFPQAFQARVQTLVEHSNKAAAGGHPQARVEQIQGLASPGDNTMSLPPQYQSFDSIPHTCYEHNSMMSSENGHRNSVVFPMNSGNVVMGLPRSQSTGDRSSPSRLYTGRGKNRNANILSAILCLIKELDYANLEVVETAVQSRMLELEAYQSP